MIQDVKEKKKSDREQLSSIFETEATWLEKK